jgi:hypothetical protein
MPTVATTYLRLPRTRKELNPSECFSLATLESVDNGDGPSGLLSHQDHCRHLSEAQVRAGGVGKTRKREKKKNWVRDEWEEEFI